MKILITGGAGFIGGNFVLKQITQTQNRILNFDKLTYAGNLNTLSSIEDNERYRHVQGDIADADQTWDAISIFRPDTIVNFAAESHVDRSIDGPMEFLNTNIMGTAVLLEACRKYLDESPGLRDTFRFLHVSTDEVYGSLGDEGFFTEKTSYDPSSPYSASKASSDHLVRAWQRTFNIPTLITNCSNNYGPYQFPEKLIPHMVLNAIEGKLLTIYGDGSNVRDWLYVEDHVRALQLIIEKGEIGVTYNIGGEQEESNLNLVEMICANLDELLPDSIYSPHKKLISFVKDRPGHDQRYSIDSSRLRNELGWKVQENISTGLRKTIKWYLDNDEWWINVINGNYKLSRVRIRN